jgi:hypothetical protein
MLWEIIFDRERVKKESKKVNMVNTTSIRKSNRIFKPVESTKRRGLR